MANIILEQKISAKLTFNAMVQFGHLFAKSMIWSLSRLKWTVNKVDNKNNQTLKH